MLPAMKNSQVIHDDEEEEVDSRSNDDMIIIIWWWSYHKWSYCYDDNVDGLIYNKCSVYIFLKV